MCSEPACPQCRMQMQSRRDCKRDSRFDRLMQQLYGDLQGFEEQARLNALCRLPSGLCQDSIHWITRPYCIHEAWLYLGDSCSAITALSVALDVMIACHTEGECAGGPSRGPGQAARAPAGKRPGSAACKASHASRCGCPRPRAPSACKHCDTLPARCQRAVPDSHCMPRYHYSCSGLNGLLALAGC